MSSGPSPAGLGDERFVSLTTFRRNGDGVATPVWVARIETGAASALVVTTGADSGKVKRLRRDPTVTLRPCSRRGKVEAGAPEVTAVAEVVDDPVAIEAHTAAIRRKYGVEWRVLMLVERLLSRGSRERVVLRIS